MFLLRLCVALLILGFFPFSTNGQEKIPSPMREMRAVWVATVANIDWPSRPGLTVEQQKTEAIKILERVKELNLNTVVLQVRPQADAIYPSPLEPWSYYLTGEQGKAPEPFYDPLQFWIQESHNRGLEIHAWLNPYRANHSALRGELSPLSIVKSKPHLVKKLGNAGYYWMNPALKEVQDHSYNVVMDILKRYDVDAIHLDDYFYPYRDYNDNKDFPDDDTYAEYKKNGGKLEKGDWRRDAVNKFIERVYKSIKKEKPLVKFGISPYGVYRPGYPENMGGTFDQYEIMSADARLWLNKGWIDYYVPQLYWNISRIDLSYPLLLKWWMGENKMKRNLWFGLFIRPEIEKRVMTTEIVSQIMVTRAMVSESPGTMLFSMQSLMNNDTLTGRTLKEGAFRNQALIPQYTWLDKKPPESPKLKVEKKDKEIKLNWNSKGKEKPFLYVIYIKKGNNWTYEILPENVFEKTIIADTDNISSVAISGVDKCGNESKKNIYSLISKK